MTSSRLVASALLLITVGLVGCGGGKATITLHPKWNYERYERVAVVPARPSDPRAQGDAHTLADRLTTLLTQNRTFTVLSRTEMEQVFAEQDLSKLADAIDEGTALPEGKIEVAQALVVPKITDYQLVAQREERVIPRYARDKQGRRLLDRSGRPIQTGEDHVFIYTHGAEVEGSVRVVDAATGKILMSHTARMPMRKKTNRDRPPSMSPEDIAAESVRELSVEFLKAVAPTQMKVSLKSKMLILATDYFDGKYDEAKKLSRAMADFLLVIRELPEECERNQFRVAIAEQDGRTNLYEEQFTWSDSVGPEGLSYRVPVAKLAESGRDKFVAKLYSVGSPEPILERKFTLEQPKDGGK